MGARGTPLAIFLGGFENQVKGGVVLLEALERIEPGSLAVVLAGPGELPESGRRLVGGREAVEWRGWLDTGQLDELWKRASIFVLPSTSEGLPMALLEAMSRGLAIVATEVGGVPDVVADEVDGLLVAPGRSDLLAAALWRLAEDPGLRQRLGRGARERAGRMGVEDVAARFDSIYRDLLAR